MAYTPSNAHVGQLQGLIMLHTSIIFNVGLLCFPLSYKPERETPHRVLQASHKPSLSSRV